MHVIYEVKAHLNYFIKQHSVMHINVRISNRHSLN